MSATRRSFLRGASLGAGALLLEPILQKLGAQAAGAPSKAPRFVFVMMPNGNIPSHIHPVGSTLVPYGQRSKLVVEKLDSYKMAASLEALEPYKKKVTILQGLSGTCATGIHTKGQGALGAYRVQNGNVPAATVDNVLGKKLGGLFVNVCLGIANDAGTTSVVFDVSASGPGKKLPTICQPELAYKTLFGSVAGGKAAKEFAVKTDVLDSMLEDVKKLEKNVAGPERELLESHLHAYEAMRDRQGKFAQLEASLKTALPEVTSRYRSKARSERLSAQFDLAAAALIGGLTHAVTISAGCGEQFAQYSYPEIGMTKTMHNYGHAEESENREVMGKFRGFLLENIVGLLKKLEAVPEGDGSMMDNTLVVFTSDFGGGHHGGSGEWPFILVGDLGGRLKSNQVVTYPSFGVKGHRTINNLYVTLLNTAGDDCTMFGTPDVKLRDLDLAGPLAELLT